MGKELLNVAERAISKLEKSVIGGIKKESAEKGIKAVQEAGEQKIEQLS